MTLISEKSLVKAFVIGSICLYTACAPKVRHTPPPVTAPAQKKPIEQPVEKPAEKPTSKPVETVAMNTLTPQEKAAGWSLLFDGTSTDGWHAYGSRTIGTAWKVANGTLYLDNDKNDNQLKTGGDIITDAAYGNFELQLDWKISKNGNSGVCIYIYEDKSKYGWMWNTGPEIQIVDNDGHPDGKIFKHKAGDLYDLVPSKTQAQRQPLEWNHYRIRCVDGKLDIYLNEVHVVSTVLWNDAWRALVAGSKFKDMPNFGTYKTGHIGLQDHGDNVWFRNIKIRPL